MARAETTPLVLGIDYGSDSVRAALVSTNGAMVASHVFAYPQWQEGLYCHGPASQYRQHPADHLQGLETTVAEVLQTIKDPSQVVGICVDTTGSSPMPVLADGTALALHSNFNRDPDAMMVLWKDHTAVAEAQEINEALQGAPTDYRTYSGGSYSPEWFWAKILHICRTNQLVALAADDWMEHCDFVTMTLTGSTPAEAKRSRCAAGHKAMWHPTWGGYPPEEFLASLHPALGKLRSKLPEATYTSDTKAGGLCQAWADKLGLHQGTPVAVGTIDAHAAAVGAGIRPGTMVKVVGTSTCDMLVSEPLAQPMPGICGEVDGSIVPGLVGLEAGQSAFGDYLAWFKSLLAFGSTAEQEERLLQKLTVEAEKLPLSDTLPQAVDWINGRRTPMLNPHARGALFNLQLGNSAPEVYFALVESLCFGSKAIADYMASSGAAINQVTAVGGVAQKSPFVMQMLADILGVEIKVSDNEQPSALGAAIYAAMVGGQFSSLAEATAAMAQEPTLSYLPRAERKEFFTQRYQRYKAAGQALEALN